VIYTVVILYRRMNKMIQLTSIYIIGPVVVFLVLSMKIIRPLERGIIERLGKYHKLAEPGLHFIIPFVDKIVKINITERIADVKPQDIITKDNLNARVDLVVYYKVKPTEDDIKRSIYNVDDFEYQITSLAQTTARNVIGDMNFIDVNNKRNILNTALAKMLDKESDAWGVQIVRVELKEITPPSDVQETMNRIIKASNEKEAATDFATATEIKADGERRAKIKEAEGIKQYSILKAEGQAKSFEMINKSFVGNAQFLKKLEVTQAALENNSKIVLTEKGISPTLIMDAIPIHDVGGGV